MERQKIGFPEKSGEISFKEFLLRVNNWRKYILSKWLIFLIAVIIGGIVGIVYSRINKPVYTASSTFVLEGGENGGGGLGQYAGLASMVGVDLGGKGEGVFQGDNLLELYKSRKMIESALLISSEQDTSKVLLDYYLALNDTRERWKKENPKLLNINFRKSNYNFPQRDRDSVLQRVVYEINKNNLLISKPDKKLSIIKVDVSSKGEVFSNEFNKALVNVVNAFYVRTKTKKSTDNIKILQYKTDSVRRVMNNNISAGAFVIDETPNINPTKLSLRVVPSQKSQFSAETNKAILGQLIQNLELAKIALLKEAPLIQIIDEPIYPLPKVGISKIKGAVFGAFIFFLLALICVTFHKLYKNLIQ